MLQRDFRADEWEEQSETNQGGLAARCCCAVHDVCGPEVAARVQSVLLHPLHAFQVFAFGGHRLAGDGKLNRLFLCATGGQERRVSSGVAPRELENCLHDVLIFASGLLCCFNGIGACRRVNPNWLAAWLLVGRPAFR